MSDTGTFSEWKHSVPEHTIGKIFPTHATKVYGGEEV